MHSRSIYSLFCLKARMKMIIHSCQEVLVLSVYDLCVKKLKKAPWDSEDDPRPPLVIISLRKPADKSLHIHRAVVH